VVVTRTAELRVERRERSGSLLRVAILGYVVALVGAEVMFAFVDPALGVALDALLAALLSAAVVLESRHEPNGDTPVGTETALAVFPLVLVPLLRIVSVSVPVPKLSEIWWYAAVAVPMLLSLVIMARFYGATWSSAVFPVRWSRTQVLIAVSGIPVGLLAYLAIRPDPIEQEFRPASFALAAAILIISPALTEELLFRGVVQSVLVGSFGWSGIVIGAALFAAASLGTRSVSYVVLAAAIGLAFGSCVWRTSSLAGVIGAHALLSLGLLLVWPQVLG
jgi:membrane protease YdiL (CAAX protease family)